MFRPFSLNLKGHLVEFDHPAVMGIVNVTTDSFYKGSRTTTGHDLASRLELMLSDGVDIIDVGAVSTRPGSQEIDEAVEMERIKKALKLIRSMDSSIPVSVDTYRASVASKAVGEWGADIVNDISGGTFDSRMFDTIAHLKVPYILTHTSGAPSVMQSKCDYTDVSAEVINFLSLKLRELHLAGVADVIVDPGFGFGKTPEQNYQMMRNLEAFAVLSSPILVGVSRKSMITRLLDIPTEEALAGTIALNTIALSKGASIIRVHDVREACQLCKMVRQCIS